LRGRYPRAAGLGHLFGAAEADAVKDHHHLVTAHNSNVFASGSSTGIGTNGWFVPEPPVNFVNGISGPVDAGSADENRPLSTVFFGAVKF
jgi:hypothetical protein